MDTIDSKFLDWYIQALGSTFGILACIYAYLKGYMFVYGNIGGYLDFLGFSGVISSYLLLPLCVLSLFLGLIKSYTLKKEILNFSFESFNRFICILTSIIGFMGAKIYFLIPAAFILYNILEPNLHNKIIENKEILFKNKPKEYIKKVDIRKKKIKEDKLKQETIIFEKVDNDVSNETEKLYKSRKNNQNVIEIKKEIALELLRKNSNKQFIVELTGFTLDEIYILEKELNNN